MTKSHPGSKTAGQKCMVIGCHSSLHNLKIWKTTRVCDIHKVVHADCLCQEPFKIFPFPEDGIKRKKWTSIVNRKSQAAGGRVLRKPKKVDGICSLHFVDGDPSLPPTILLGYDDPQMAVRYKDQIYNLKKWKSSTPLLDINEHPTSHDATELQPSTMIRVEMEQEDIQSEGIEVGSDSQVGHVDLPEVTSASTLPRKRTRPTNSTKRISSCLEYQEDPTLPSSMEGYISVAEDTETESSVTSSDIYKGSITKSESESSIPVNTPPEKVSLMETEDELRSEISRLREKCETWEKKYISLKRVKEKDPLTFLESDKKVKHYTGFSNFATFEGFFKILEPRAERMSFWTRHGTPAGTERVRSDGKRPGPPRQLSLKSEFLMTLMRLRLGMLYETLSDLFEVSVDCVSRVCITWIKFLAIEWRCLLFEPTLEEIRATLPRDFRASAPNTRYIIDGTELFCDSTGDLYMQAFLWSNYKHHNTVKFLVAIAPNGHISFLSEGYGGRITDKEITRVSGFYDILQAYDEVMADKGFPIAPELNQKLCTLSIPKGRRGIDQFSAEDISQIKTVARTRVHVERCIERIKNFRILSSLPFTLLPQISDIMTICCAITNTLPPLIAE